MAASPSSQLWGGCEMSLLFGGNSCTNCTLFLCTDTHQAYISRTQPAQGHSQWKHS